MDNESTVVTATPQESIYDSPDHKRSRKAYLIECAFEYFVSLMVSGVFLDALLKDLAIDDATKMIVQSLISLAFLFQLFSIIVVQRISNVKVFAVAVHIAGQVMFMSIYLIPFLGYATENAFLTWAWEHRAIWLIAGMLIAYFGNYLVTSMIYKWGNSFVEPHHRARYSATKEMVSLISGMAVTLGVGFALDVFSDPERAQMFDGIKNIHVGFIFVAVATLIFCICDLVCLLMIKGEKKPKVEKKDIVPFREVMHNTLGNKKFVYVMLLMILWDIGRFFTIGAIYSYQTNAHELGLSVLVVTIISNAGCLARFFVSRPFGKFSDKHSYAKGIELALIIAAAAFACCVFTTPATKWLIVGYVLLFNICQAGISQNMHNILFSYVDSRYFVQASAIKNSVAGILGFGASIVASKLLDYIQSNGNMLFGIHVYAQQVLGLISFVILVGTAFFVHFVVSKQKAMVQ